MASRLTVVISQSAAREKHSEEIEESLLTELMLAAGMDATLIGPLANLRLDSTDYLCLSGFMQSLALVSDLSTAEVTEHWQRLQLPGQVVPLAPAGSGQIARPSAGRRIYHVPLALGTASIVEHLRRLLADKAVQTVSVSLPLSAKTAGSSSGSLPVVSRPVPPATAAVTAPENVHGHSAAAPAPGNRSVATNVVNHGSASHGSASHGDASHGTAGNQPTDWANRPSAAEWPDLERLVEDFDSLDI